MGHELVFVGTVVLLALVGKGALHRARIPPLVGYLALGFGASIAAAQTDTIGTAGLAALEALGLVGVTVLLFRVGLKSMPGRPGVPPKHAEPTGAHG